MAKSALFRTKANAVHAGLSQPLVPPLLPSQSELAKLPPTIPNSNSLPALPPSATRVAMVAGTSTHGTTCRPLLRSPLLPTPTPQAASVSPAPATPPSFPQASLTPRAPPLTTTPAAATLLCSPLSSSSPTQSLSRLTRLFSSNTLVVSSPPPLAEPPSTTPSSLSATALTQLMELTGSFKTHGAPDGVSTAMS